MNTIREEGEAAAAHHTLCLKNYNNNSNSNSNNNITVIKKTPTNEAASNTFVNTQ